ncbi:MAG: DEAD/DEAH box helicase [Acidobacteriia bacterium]|nr:DEAD/DEAH box helicase [Terriglobia bacterium]
MRQAAGQVFISFFSRLFPKTKDVEVHVDSSVDESNVYVDVSLRHGDAVYRFENLGKLPARIKVGDRYFRISQKNRHTLIQLANLDARFDPQKGFVFPERDVPEVLNYLRPKASVEFSKASKRIHVDEKPLEYEHNVSQVGEDVEVETSLASPDSRIRIDAPQDAKFIEGSKYAHAPSGYFRKPQERKFETLTGEIGKTRLRGDQIPFFLLHDLKRIQSEPGSKVARDVQSQRVIVQQFQPKVSLQVDGPWIWFDVRYEADKFKVGYQEMEKLDSSRSFIRHGEAWIQADKQTHARVAERVEEIPEVEAIEERFRTRTYHFDEVQSLLEQVASLDISDAYAQFRKALEDFSQIEEHPLPYSLKGILRSYQKHGYDWLAFLAKYGLNGILADEMGLGKTAQALTKLLDAHAGGEAGTSLVVCPPSVLSSWQDDLKKFTSPVEFRTAIYMGSNRQRILKDLHHYQAILTTYNIVTRDIEILSKVTWEYVVLDEAQKIKNVETTTAKTCKKLIGKHKLAITGTPIENRLSELWSIYDFLMPSYLGTQSYFRDQFEIPIMKRNDRGAQERLRRRVSPFKLRREKTLVASELPAKIPMDRYCELTPEQVQLYKRYALAERDRIAGLPGDKVRIDTSVLTAILRLKQICCHPALVTEDSGGIYKRSGKLEAFVEVLDEIIENDEKALIFSQFTQMHSILRRVLGDKQLRYFYLDGSTPIKERARLKEDFQRGEVPFFLISLQAGGLGMTLTEANCVIHYDRWWNPAVEDQATDRVHRIGQKKPVKVFKIHTRGTIDERIDELQAKKKDLFNSVIEVDQMRKEITKEELLALFAAPLETHRGNGV